MAVNFHPPPKRILVRGVNWLGDAVMTTPALMRLREQFPGTHIALLTPEKLRELWLHHPAVDELIGFEAATGLLSVSRTLRAGKFHMALVLPNSPRSALETWLAGIPRRVGYARPWRNWFLTQPVATRPGYVKMRKRTVVEIQQLVQSAGANSETKNQQSATAHQVHEYLHLVATLGASASILPPQLRVTEEEVRAAAGRFQLAAETRWLGINPGAEYGPAKRWPIENFLFMAREAAAWPGWGVLLFGGKADMPASERIEQEFRKVTKQWASPVKFVNLAGRTSLRELMALLKLCRGLITNDTGPMHVAAALGTPVVVPFGSTSPELTGPGLPGDSRHRLLKSEVSCSPCFLRECPIDFRCMKSIGVDRVTEAALDVFSH